MNFEDLLGLYEQSKDEYGEDAYKHISELFIKASEVHKEQFTGNDWGQSWRAFKGKNFEKLVTYIIRKEVVQLDLEIIDGNKLDRMKEVTEVNDRGSIDDLRDNLMIAYRQNQDQVPDADLVVYDPEDNKIIAVISCKVTLRERIAQTGYWKLKLLGQDNTKHIKVYFVTLDEDETLIGPNNIHNKARTIAENDIDTCYVISDKVFTETTDIKGFDKLLADLKGLIS